MRFGLSQASHLDMKARRRPSDSHLATKRSRFKTRREVDRYFGGKTIRCLLCGRRFRRLAFHLAAKHGITADDYKARFGLPWTRGLTSAASRCAPVWTKQRRAEASRVAKRRRIFELARRSKRRRKLAAFLRAEAVSHLGTYARGFGKKFEARVRALFDKGHIDKAIARALGVSLMTVNLRTRHWRKRS